MEKKHILVFLVCTVAALSTLSVISYARVLAFNEVFAAYEQAYNASISQGIPFAHFENVTYYSIGLTRNRTDLRVENIGTAQFVISSVLWFPSSTFQSSAQLLALTLEEYDMYPGSGVIQPNCTLLITVRWGVSSGNISENEWSPDEAYFWEIIGQGGGNYGATVKPGDNLSVRAAKEAEWYLKTRAEMLAHSQETHAKVLYEGSLFMSQMCILVGSTFVVASASFYMARCFRLGLRSVFQKQVIALVMWIILSAPVLSAGSVILVAIKNGWNIIYAADMWSYLHWAGCMELGFLEVWMVTCFLGALFIYLVFNFRRRTAVPHYKSFWVSLVGAVFVFSAFTVTLPLTDSTITTLLTSVGTSMTIMAASVCVRSVKQVFAHSSSV